MVILASVKVNFWLGFTAATIMILGAAYTLWMYKRVIYGAVANERVAKLTDLSRREFWLLASVTALVLWLGQGPALGAFAAWGGWRDLMGLILLAAIGGAVYVGIVLALFGRQWLAQLRRRRTASAANNPPDLPLE